jgi:hypothetical protein
MQFFEHPCHPLPERFHEFDTLGVLFHFSFCPADTERPADNDDLAAQKEMVLWYRGRESRRITALTVFLSAANIS